MLAETAIMHQRSFKERTIAERFLDARDETSFSDLFRAFHPQLVSFFRARGCNSIAEDLAQEVMLTVYLKAGQIRDRLLFRAWMFKIARHALSRHYGKHAHEVETVDLTEVPDHLVASAGQSCGTPTFEFHDWMAFLDDREREAVTLRFIEQWEYHEIAAAQGIPIGTVQWRVFAAKKKLAPHLKRAEAPSLRKAA